jgi:hypothetical protein
LRLSCYPNQWFTSALGAGLSLRLKAVQVIELADRPEVSGDVYGFDDEDGYVADESEKEDSDSGVFDEDSNDEEDEGSDEVDADW